jgi:zona occludens toxin
MINLLMGPPGAGKSYEAVVFHILPALLEGRKVITNLPLQVDAFREYGVSSSLIELKNPTLENPKPFSTIEDYGSDWRGENGIGPLYVIDECHKPLPKGMASRLVEEWFAEHRHEGADVLLITQSYGKISQSIRDMVQLCYRVRKATALGSDKKYIRKVQDGLRGEVMNENIRSYDSSRFHLYKSHTKSNTAVSEAAAKDVRPFWKHWSIVGAAMLVPLGVLMLVFTAGDVFSPDLEPPEKVAQGEPVTVQQSSPHIRPYQRPEPDLSVAKAEPEPKKVEEIDHPFSGLGLHISAYLHSDASQKTIYSISVSQNGQRVFRMPDSDLVKAGYEVEHLTPCLIKVSYDKYIDYVTCDAPRQSVSL